MDESPLPTPFAPLRDILASEESAPPQTCLMRPHNGTPEYEAVTAKVDQMVERYADGRDLWTGERLTGNDRVEHYRMKLGQRDVG